MFYNVIAFAISGLVLFIWIQSVSCMISLQIRHMFKAQAFAFLRRILCYGKLNAECQMRLVDAIQASSILYRDVDGVMSESIGNVTFA